MKIKKQNFIYRKLNMFNKTLVYGKFGFFWS